MPRLKNPYIGPGVGGHIGEIFLHQTTRIRSHRGKALVMRSQPIAAMKLPYPELCDLAQAVIRQACLDAGHIKMVGYGMRKKRLSRSIMERYRRNACWDALQFLTDPNDEWLGWWCELAGVNPHHIRHEFAPYRAKFEAEFTKFCA